MLEELLIFFGNLRPCSSYLMQLTIINNTTVPISKYIIPSSLLSKYSHCTRQYIILRQTQPSLSVYLGQTVIFSASSTVLAKKVCPKLLDSASDCRGEFTQPRMHFFGLLCITKRLMDRRNILCIPFNVHHLRTCLRSDNNAWHYSAFFIKSAAAAAAAAATQSNTSNIIQSSLSAHH